MGRSGVMKPFAELLPQTGGAGDSPKIVFGSVRNGGNNDVFVMNLDGSNETRLTTNAAYDDQPKWSPDNSKILFMSDRDDNFELYSMNADGSTQTRLTNTLAPEGFAEWSPDGSRIAFVVGDLRNPSAFEIYVMNADGTNRTRLTNDTVIDGVPAWSPDGSKMVFMSGGSSVFAPNSFEIYVMNADGSNRTRLTDNNIVDGQPSFSLDGSKILFAAGDAMNPDGIEIYVMNANGSNKIALTSNTVTDGFPAWSPDGTKIVFASGSVSDETGVELFLMNADGSNKVRLTTNNALDWFPDLGSQPSSQLTIAGRVTDYKGNGVSNITITLRINRAGTIETRTTQTDPSGNYSSGGILCANSVEVTPSKNNSAFSPKSLTFVSTSCLSGSQTANFALVPPIVISQFYTAGGETGATYRNDFVELFNRGDTTIDLAGWSLQFTDATGTVWQRLNLPSFSLVPGQHYLVQLGSGGGVGTLLPTPDVATGISMSSAGGKLALLSSADPLVAGPCPVSSSAIDFIGYGASATCFEGLGPAPVPSAGTADRRSGDGCADTDNNAGDFTLGLPNPRNRTSSSNPYSQWQPVVLTAAQIVEIKGWTVGGRTYVYVKPQYPDAGYRVTNWGQVVRSVNDFTVDAGVEKFTGASILAVVTTAQIYDLGPLADGTYNFSFKTSGTLAKTLQFTVSSAVPPPNPIDNAREFVKQQYRDFLNREADQAGEDFWTDNITKCMDPARRPAGQTEAQCTLRQRETTSGAFFLSPEFQYTGYFVYRMYQGALGRQPKLSEFTPDALFMGNGIVVNGQLSAAKINQNKAEYAALFVNCVDATKYRCAEFKAIYDPLSNQQYVDKLFQTTGVNASAADRTALVDGLNANPATETRATVLQKVVDGINVISEGNQQFTTTYGQAFYNQQFTRAFVQLEYFGYMKRDPDEAGYAFWLDKLNQFGGDFVAAEMVLAFISSPEYRARFGQP